MIQNCSYRMYTHLVAFSVLDVVVGVNSFSHLLASSFSSLLIMGLIYFYGFGAIVLVDSCLWRGFDLLLYKLNGFSNLLIVLLFYPVSVNSLLSCLETHFEAPR